MGVKLKRIEDQVERFATGFRDRVLATLELTAQALMTPARLQAMRRAGSIHRRQATGTRR